MPADAPAYAHEVLAALFRVRDGKLQLLCWQRAEEPYAGRWALPGGLLTEDELMGAALARQLERKVDVDRIAHLEQLETRSEPDRDPRGRVIATAYLGLIPSDLDFDLPEDTAWRSADRLPRMAFDHASIARSGRARLRAKLSYTNLGFALAPPTFTMPQLREIYAAVLGHDLSTDNLTRVLKRRGVVEPVGDETAPRGRVGRPGRIYRFSARTLVVTDEFAVFRPAR